MTVFHAGFACLLVTLTTFLTVTVLIVQVGVLPVRIGTPECGCPLWLDGRPLALGVLPARIGPPKCQCRPAHLWMTARGLWLDGRPVTLGELPARLGSARAVALEADDGILYDDVVHAIDAIRGAGVTEIGVLP